MYLSCGRTVASMLAGQLGWHLDRSMESVFAVMMVGHRSKARNEKKTGEATDSPTSSSLGKPQSNKKGSEAYSAVTAMWKGMEVATGQRNGIEFHSIYWNSTATTTISKIQ
ncbi:hypothetical protein L1887_16965 [Cichorium endivia]|nr:hypothetical protein L1887_16965 [Cichorium endivia]